MQLLALHGRTRVVVVIGLMAFCCGSSSGQAASARTVHFVVTDCWGNAVPSVAIHIDSIEPTAAEERLSYPAEHKMSLRPGSYHVLLEAQGFFANSWLMEVSESDLDLRGCLTVAPIEGTVRPKINLQGSISVELLDINKHPWVRLVAVYCNSNVTAPVSAQGRFSVPGLQPGRYLLLLLDSDGIKTQKALDIRAPSTTVRLP